MSTYFTNLLGPGLAQYMLQFGNPASSSWGQGYNEAMSGTSQTDPVSLTNALGTSASTASTVISGYPTLSGSLGSASTTTPTASNSSQSSLSQVLSSLIPLLQSFSTASTSSAATSTSTQTAASTPSIATSTTDSDFVKMYQTLLGRTPSAAELSVMDKDLTTGQSLKTIYDGIVTSPEYQNKEGNSTISNTAYVTNLYEDILGRAPDAAGLQSWETDLANGMSRTTAAADMANSAESIQKNGLG